MPSQAKPDGFPSIQFYSVTEAALIFGVTKQQIYEWVDQEIIPVYYAGLGRPMIRIYYRDLEKLVAEHRSKSNPHILFPE